MEPINNIPREHDDRLNKHTPALFSAAKKVFDIAGEFDCEKYVTESKDGLRITIERVRPNIVTAEEIQRLAKHKLN